MNFFVPINPISGKCTSPDCNGTVFNNPVVEDGEVVKHEHQCGKCMKVYDNWPPPFPVTAKATA